MLLRSLWKKLCKNHLRILAAPESDDQLFSLSCL